MSDEERTLFKPFELPLGAAPSPVQREMTAMEVEVAEPSPIEGRVAVFSSTGELVPGPKFTISKAPPSGGEPGDIWYIV